MYITIIFFIGFVVVFLIYYYCKARMGSDLDYRPSVKLPQNVGEQKRKHPRADINWPVSMEISDGSMGGEIINISLGGAFICCKKPLPLGEVFRLTMTAPDDEPVAATAEVVWSNVNVPDEKVVNRGMGVRFLKMSDRHLQLVRKVVQTNAESAIPGSLSPVKKLNPSESLSLD